jgi:hypothetical protein
MLSEISQSLKEKITCFLSLMEGRGEKKKKKTKS